MLNFIRKIDEFIWHCPHPCACLGSPDPKTHPKAFRYASILVTPQGSQLVPVAALSITISPVGGSIAFHRAWAKIQGETPADLKPCDLLGQCFLAREIATRGSEVSVPLRGIGPWYGKNQQATFANLKAGGDRAMGFIKTFAQSGTRVQPESFWGQLQILLVTGAAPILAQGGQGP